VFFCQGKEFVLRRHDSVVQRRDLVAEREKRG